VRLGHFKGQAESMKSFKKALELLMGAVPQTK